MIKTVTVIFSITASALVVSLNMSGTRLRPMRPIMNQS